MTTVLSDSYGGSRFIFCNNAAVAADGTIYFTDSSTKFGFEHWRGDLLEHRPTGRLFRRDPDGTLTVLLDGLAFANGVALAADESFVVVAETAGYALRRVWLTGERAGPAEPFGPTLPGFPDNISTGEDGNIWVAIASPRDRRPGPASAPGADAAHRSCGRCPSASSRSPSRSSTSRPTRRTGRWCTTSRAGTTVSASRPVSGRSVAQVWMGSFEQTTIAVFDLP